VSNSNLQVLWEKTLKIFRYEKGPGKPSNTVNRSRMREVKGSLTWAVSC